MDTWCQRLLFLYFFLQPQFSMWEFMFLGKLVLSLASELEPEIVVRQSVGLIPLVSVQLWAGNQNHYNFRLNLWECRDNYIFFSATWRWKNTACGAADSLLSRPKPDKAGRVEGSGQTERSFLRGHQ